MNTDDLSTTVQDEGTRFLTVSSVRQLFIGNSRLEEKQSLNDFKMLIVTLC